MENKKLYLYEEEYDVMKEALEGWVHRDKLYYESIKNLDKNVIIDALESYIDYLQTTDAEMYDHLDWNTRLCMHCMCEIDLCEERYDADVEKRLLHKIKSILGPKNISIVDIVVKK